MSKHVRAIPVCLELAENHRDLALFTMEIDRKLRDSHLVKIKVVDVMASEQIKEWALVFLSRTPKPVRFEMSEGTRAFVEKWMKGALMVRSEYLWPGRYRERLHILTRQYARIVRGWVTSTSLVLRKPLNATEPRSLGFAETRIPESRSSPPWRHQDGQQRPSSLAWNLRI